MESLLFLQLLHFVAYATLVSALVGVFRGVRRRRHLGTSTDAGFLQFLPLAAMAVSALIKKKAQGNAQKAELERAEEERRSQFDTDEEARQRSWEERSGSPAAQSDRMSATMRLGKLLGQFGGRAGAPPSLLSALDARRATPEYQARTYRPGSTKGPGGQGWGFAGELVTGATKFAKDYAKQKEYEE